MKLKIEDLAIKKLGEDFAEGVEHGRRLYDLACKIADEDYDDDALFAACLLHNISQKEPYEKKSALEAITFLRKARLDEKSLSIVADAIPNHLPEEKPQTYEGKLLHDAHILDSVGCIGIIRWAKEDYKDLPGRLASRLALLRRSRSGQAGKKNDLDTLIKEVKEDIKDLPKYLILSTSKPIFRRRAAHAKRFLIDIKKELNG